MHVHSYNNIADSPWLRIGSVREYNKMIDCHAKCASIDFDSYSGMCTFCEQSFACSPVKWVRLLINVIITATLSGTARLSRNWIEQSPAFVIALAQHTNNPLRTKNVLFCCFFFLRLIWDHRTQRRLHAASPFTHQISIKLTVHLAHEMVHGVRVPADFLLFILVALQSESRVAFALFEVGEFGISRHNSLQRTLRTVNYTTRGRICIMYMH